MDAMRSVQRRLQNEIFELEKRLPAVAPDAIWTPDARRAPDALEALHSRRRRLRRRLASMLSEQTPAPPFRRANRQQLHEEHPMQTCRVKRNHRKDLVFEGVEVARASERENNHGLHTWMDLVLYRTRVGKFILSSNLCGEAFESKPRAGALAFASMEDMQEFVDTEQLMHMDVVHLLLDRARGRTALSA
jgi:hypothetical protein